LLLLLPLLLSLPLLLLLLRFFESATASGAVLVCRTDFQSICLDPNEPERLRHFRTPVLEEGFCESSKANERSVINVRDGLKSAEKR
jgi:hypothetical protein